MEPLLITSVPETALPAIVLILRRGRLICLHTALSQAEAEALEDLARDLRPELGALWTAVEALNH